MSISPARVVLISEADVALPMARDAPLDFRLRATSVTYVDRVVGVFRDAGFEVLHYKDPGSFAANATTLHRADVAFSLWHGSGTRSQVALVPAICEACGVRYIGADTYARIICEDKALARDFARDVGLNVPDGIVVRARGDYLQNPPSPGPLVIKPVFGGMSQGVRLYRPESDGSLSAVIDSALGDGRQPVLVETFCPGREVMVVMAGRADALELFEAVEVVNIRRPDYFHTTIFDADLKQTMSSRDWEMRRVTHELPEAVRELLVRTFAALGQVHYLRIDGRWDGMNFHFIELSPTPHFNKMAPLPVAAGWNGMTAADVAGRLVALSAVPQTDLPALPATGRASAIRHVDRSALVAPAPDRARQEDA